jgi:hypothetical protein
MRTLVGYRLNETEVMLGEVVEECTLPKTARAGGLHAAGAAQHAGRQEPWGGGKPPDPLPLSLRGGGVPFLVLSFPFCFTTMLFASFYPLPGR